MNSLQYYPQFTKKIIPTKGENRGRQIEISIAPNEVDLLIECLSENNGFKDDVQNYFANYHTQDYYAEASRAGIKDDQIEIDLRIKILSNIKKKIQDKNPNSSMHLFDYDIFL